RPIPAASSSSRPRTTSSPPSTSSTAGAPPTACPAREKAAPPGAASARRTVPGAGGTGHPRPASRAFPRAPRPRPAPPPPPAARQPGGAIRTGRPVTGLPLRGEPILVRPGQGELTADRVLTCAGLHSDQVAGLSGAPDEPRIVPFRGDYWQLRQGRRHLARNL